MDEVRFFSDEHYRTPKRVVYIGEILKVRSFKRKEEYYFGIELEDEQLEFIFREPTLCKEWLGYLSQAMTFANFLQQKQLYSRADSFKHYMSTLVPSQGQQVVILREGMNPKHTALPSEKEVTRSLQSTFPSI